MSPDKFKLDGLIRLLNQTTTSPHLSGDVQVEKSDGFIGLFIGPAVPEGMKSNWIETMPGTDIFIGLRTYGPEDSVLDGTCKTPRFEQVE